MQDNQGTIIEGGIDAYFVLHDALLDCLKHNFNLLLGIIAFVFLWLPVFKLMS